MSPVRILNPPHTLYCSDQRLPDRGRGEREERQLKQERLRSQKWAEMLRDSKKYFGYGAKHRDKMVSRVYKGIPDSVRGGAWHILLDIDRIKKEQPGKYKVITPARSVLQHTYITY